MKVLRRLFDAIESSPHSVGLWLVGGGGVIVIRHFLETMLEQPHMLGMIGHMAKSELRFFVHFPALYFWGMLLVAVIVKILSGRPMERVVRVAVTGMWIMCVVPVIDALVSHGQGFTLAYFNSYSEMGHDLAYFAVPWVSAVRLTPGLRVECGLILLLAALYTYCYRRSVWRTILAGALAPCLLITILGGIPLFFASICGSRIAAPIHGVEYVSPALMSLVGSVLAIVPDQALAILNLLILLLATCASYFLYDRRRFLALLGNVRLFRVLHYTVLMICGMAIGYCMMLKGTAMPIVPADVLGFAGAIIALFLACQVAVIVNDLADVDGDAISNPGRPLVRGLFCPAEYRSVGVVVFILSCAFAFAVSYFFFLMLLTFQTIYYLYSAPPFRLKRIFPVNVLAIVANGLVVLIAGLAILAKWETFRFLTAKVVLLSTIPYLLSVHIITLKDTEADAREGVSTIPVLLGPIWGRRVVALMVFLSAFVPPVVLGAGDLWLPAAGFGIVACLLVLRRNWSERAFFVCYFIYLAVVITKCIIMARAWISRT